MESSTTAKDQHLQVHTVDTESGSLQFDTTPSADSAVISPELDAQANDILHRLLTVDAKNLQEQKNLANAVSSLGYPIQKELSKQSDMLKAPMATLIKDAEDGGKVANSLLDLQAQVSEINPNQIDFTMGAVRKTAIENTRSGHTSCPLVCKISGCRLRY